MPSELAELPPAATGALQSDADLIPASALELTRAELAFTGEGEAALVLRDIAHVYVLASSRLAAIDAKARLFTGQ